MFLNNLYVDLGNDGGYVWDDQIRGLLVGGLFFFACGFPGSFGVSSCSWAFEERFR